MIQRLNVNDVPIQIQDFIFTNQRNEQRKRGCYGCGELGYFVEVCPNKPTPKTKKKACKDKALTSIRSWDDSSSEEENHHKRRRHNHSSSTSRVCLMARGNKKTIPSDSDNDSDSDDELPSFDEIVQENLNFAKVCTSQQKKLEKLKEKLVLPCFNNMKLLPILMWSYLLKLSNLRLVQTQIIAQSMMSNL
jgi:hypothetical protein